MSSSSKATMARAAMAALEPLVEMLLEMGVTSPEAESLLRSMFVHRARAWLEQLEPSGTSPSDARVALVTGVHRNFVRHILAEPPRIAKTRQQKGSHTARVLSAWCADPFYLDSEGKPLDLPEKGNAPSFQSLATTYLPSTAAGVLLSELRRAGQVQRLPDDRIRLRSRTVRAHGLTMDSVAEVGERTRRLVETLRYNLRHPDERRVAESIPDIEIGEESLPAARELITRRTLAFLARLESELGSETPTGKRSSSQKRVRVGLSVFASEQPTEK